ncbi:MAG: hypothetical protein JO362_04860 [Streptomycetaceae bacterium]|nr:hypothetical protein [Streptomycetaceae bacterium]
MGYTVLYIAFGVVALWLLGEVLLQDKARLRWRVLAFVGFLGVVVGVVLPQVVVIILGAAAFGVGQTLVTLSHQRGFSTGWVLGGRPSSSRRRKGAGPPSASAATAGDAEGGPAVGVGPTYDAGQPDYQSGYQSDYLAQSPGGFGQNASVHSSESLHGDTGEYGIHGEHGSYASASYTSGEYESYGTQGQEYGSEWQPQPDWQNAANPTSYQEPFPQQEFIAYGYEQQPYQEQQSGAGYRQEQYQGFDAYQQQPPQEYTYEPYAEQHTQAYEYDTPRAGLWPPQPDPGEHPYIPQQAPPTHDEPQPQHFDPYEPYRY